MERINRNSIYKVDETIHDKMKSIYLGCPQAIKYCKSLGIPEEVIDKNIDIIYDFAMDINHCNKCPGIDNCVKENPLLCTRITYEDGFLERQLTPCKRLLEKMKVRNQFIVMDFDEDWLNSDFTKLDKLKGREKAIKQYLQFCKSGDSKWMYLIGEQNTGRSYVAANFVIDIAKKEKGPIAFINCPLRLRQINQTNYKNPELYQKIVDQYSTVPVLVLDDFGNETINDNARDTIYEILNRRAGSRLFTIFTSNLTIEEIVNQYSTNKSTSVRAKQLGRILENNIKEEINLGEIGVYK